MSNFNIGKGITITTGFDLGSNQPLDARTVVDNLNKLEELPDSIIYPGLMVFVIDQNKLYQYKEIIEEDKDPYMGWGPIEAEVSAKEIISIEDEIDFKNTEVLIMQNNKKNFFPMTHERCIFVGEDGQTLEDKYQLKTMEEDLDTDAKTITGAINEINSKLDNEIEQFEKDVQETIEELDTEVSNMITSTQEEIRVFKENTAKDFTQIQTDILAQKNALEETIAGMEQEVNDRIDAALANMENTILTNEQVTAIMNRIETNKSSL